MREPLNFRLVRSDTEKCDVMGLRTEVYVNDKKRLSDADSMRETFDRFDGTSQYILAYSERRPVCGIKIIADSALGLPCESVTSIQHLRAYGKIVEFGHLLTTREQRTTRLAMAIIRLGLAYAVTSLSARFIVGDFFVDDDSAGELQRFYRTLGFTPLCEPYADTRFTGAPLSVVAAFDILKAAASWAGTKGRRRALLQYFFSDFPHFASLRPILTGEN